MRDCDPIVLILLIWIWRGHSSLCSECKFGYSICWHLLRISILQSVFFVFNCFLYWVNWIWLGLALLNTIVLTFYSVSVNFLHLLVCNVCWLRGLHLNLMTSSFIFLYEILYLSWKRRIVGIVKHISVGLWSFMWLPRCYNPFILHSANNLLFLLRCIILLMAKRSFVCCRALYQMLLLFLRFVSFLAFLLLRNRFFNAVPACWYRFTLLLSSWLIMRNLAWNYRH